MTTNALEAIKQAEIQAEEAINETKKKVEKMIVQAEEVGANNVTAAESQVSSQIGEIVEEAKKKIQTIKTQKERQLDNELKILNNIDKKRLDQAADIIIKKIIS